MPYTYDDYPDALKALAPDIRNKAVDILNKVIENKDMEIGIAIATSISRARDWAANRGMEIDQGSDDIKEHGEDVYVSPHENAWSVRKEKSEKLSHVFKTKSEAISKARELAKKSHGSLTIQRKDGKIQKRKSYNKQK